MREREREEERKKDGTFENESERERERKKKKDNLRFYKERLNTQSGLPHIPNQLNEKKEYSIPRRR